MQMIILNATEHSHVEGNIEGLNFCPYCMEGNVEIVRWHRGNSKFNEYQARCRDCYTSGPIHRDRDVATHTWNILPRNSKKLLERADALAKIGEEAARLLNWNDFNQALEDYLGVRNAR